MDAVNKKIAMVVSVIALLLLVLALSTNLSEYMWFKFLFGVWLFVLCSSFYRLTALFKSRNRLDNFIQRDAQHLMLFSLTGFFDKKHGPHWLVISNIERVESKNDELIIHSSNDRQLSVSLPAQSTELDAFVKRILTESEKQTIHFG
ncbi:hypothetical protein V6237_18190 [Pseudoalteromonas carrageenovora]|uniref:hypothetical protein n=1 Tax=Pseudoalteromonas carrageenovora TaxID=227 RepID=UPI0031204194